MSENRCWKFGENLDTDQILPSQYLVLSSVSDMMKHAMEPQGRDFAKLVKAGDVIVGGGNFGCGSSREQAPMVLKASGIAAVIAPSFGRIYFRNSINMGLLTIELPQTAIDEINDGDALSVDAAKGLVVNATSGKRYTFEPLQGLPRDILDAGGLLPYLDQQKKMAQATEQA